MVGILYVFVPWFLLYRSICLLRRSIAGQTQSSENHFVDDDDKKDDDWQCDNKQ